MSYFSRDDFLLVALVFESILGLLGVLSSSVSSKASCSAINISFATAADEDDENTFCLNLGSSRAMA